MADGFSGEMSEFNMAVSFLTTLRTLLNLCADHSTNLNIYEWYHTLMAIRREIYDDMSPDQQKSSAAERKALHELVADYIAKSENGHAGIESDLYEALDSYELFLRGIISKKGYKTKMMDSPERALKA